MASERPPDSVMASGRWKTVENIWCRGGCGKESAPRVWEDVGPPDSVVEWCRCRRDVGVGLGLAVVEPWVTYVGKALSVPCGRSCLP